VSKSYLINLIAFYDEMTDSVDEGREADIYLDVSNGFDIISHHIVIDKLMKYGLE